MKAIILQHENGTPPGSTTLWLEKNNISYEIIRTDQKSLVLESKNFNILVICGGSMNIDQENKFPWLIEEKKIIKTAIHESKLVIGLCLGAQLIAEALGGKVRPMSGTEFGWQDVQLIDDSIWNSSAKTLKVFQWHSYCFSNIPGAKTIATSPQCAEQAFVFKKNVMGFQFHPESNHEWIKECAEERVLPAGPYCQTKAEVLEIIHQQVELQSMYFKVLDPFLKNWKEQLPPMQR